MRSKVTVIIAGLLSLLVVLTTGACTKPASVTSPTPSPKSTPLTVSSPTPPAKSSPAPKPTPSPAAKSTTPTSKRAAWLPDVIKIGLGGTGGVVYTNGVALQPTIEEWFNVPARALGLDAIKERIGEVRDGRFTFLLENSGNIVSAMMGDESFADAGWGPQKTMVAWTTFLNYQAVVTTKDARYKTIRDIKGAKVSWGPHSPAWMSAVKGYVAFAGLTMNDVVLVPFGSWADGQKSVVEGKTDVAHISADSATAFEIATHPKGIRVLELPPDDKAAWQRLLSMDPGRGISKLKNCPQQLMGTDGFVMVGSVVVYPNAPEEFVYQLVKCLVERYDSYKGKHLSLTDASVETNKKIIESTSLLWHPGAIRYLKEVGLWSADIDKWHNQKLELWSKYRSAWDAAVKEAEATGIKVSDKNEKWMALWNKYREPLPKVAIRGS